MTTPLSGQTAIVTGGARGIGYAIAQRLAADGCRIVVWDIDVTLIGTAGEFQPALAQRVDVTSVTSIGAAFADAVAQFGKIEILVNNAGINGPVAEVTDYPLDAWDSVIAVDLTGVFYCCRAVVPHMRERGYGRIVNVSSIAGKEGTAGVAAYCAAKAGVIGFAKALARELATSGVTVNSVTPVMAETELLREMTPAHIAAARSKIPMNRFVTVEEIAAMVTWIAGPECSFTAGGVFDISGGRANY
ncbi:MAG: SDR family NAD(P)-dependent oxidoreductase [Planctomycetia bacterium]|nr:SDR family NAD(P)-dependent oxidoreductase [Planctomycetia bacterium]